MLCQKHAPGGQHGTKCPECAVESLIAIVKELRAALRGTVREREALRHDVHELRKALNRANNVRGVAL